MRNASGIPRDGNELRRLRRLLKHWCSKNTWLMTRPQQTTFCYCPSCRHELCGDDAVACEDGRDGVRYVCVCGCVSLWDFDAPVPLLLRTAMES